MPQDYRHQISDAKNISTFNGHYELSDKSKRELSFADEKHNGLNRFQNQHKTPVNNKEVYIPGVTSVDICATNGKVYIRLFSGEKLVDENFFEKERFKFKDGILELHDDVFVRGGLCAVSVATTITMYHTITNEVVVKVRDTGTGMIIMVPVIGGENYWFKLKRVD